MYLPELSAPISVSLVQSQEFKDVSKPVRVKNPPIVRYIFLQYFTVVLLATNLVAFSKQLNFTKSLLNV